MEKERLEINLAEQLLLRQLPKPEPMPNLEVYLNERELALARDHRTRENYELYQRANRSPNIDYLPIKMDIENVSRCNFRCTMCQVSIWPKMKRAEDMSFEDFQKLIDEQYGLVEVKIQGMGEPLMGRDTFFNMIKYARSKHIWVRIATNASLLHLKENYRKLIDSGVNEVQISVDGATKETFEGIRNGSDFERVTENCRLINAYCRDIGILRTKMWTVVQKGNLQELEALVDLGNELGFTSIVFSPTLNDWGQENWNRYNREISVENQMTIDRAYQLIRAGQSYGIKVAFWNTTYKFSTESPDKLCPWPFERAYVSSDMKIVPCCMIANPDVVNLGDARQFTSAWKDKIYQDFRQAHLKGIIPQICKGCYVDNNSL